MDIGDAQLELVQRGPRASISLPGRARLALICMLAWGCGGGSDAVSRATDAGANGDAGSQSQSDAGDSLPSACSRPVGTYRTTVEDWYTTSSQLSCTPPASMTLPLVDLATSEDVGNGCTNMATTYRRGDCVRSELLDCTDGSYTRVDCESDAAGDELHCESVNFAGVGSCIVEVTFERVECPAWAMTDEGGCEQCQDDTVCPAGTTCVGGTCLCDATRCEGGCDPETQLCTTSPASSCENDSDCTAGQVCDVSGTCRAPGTPGSRKFVFLQTDGSEACGLRDDDSLACWGGDPPEEVGSEPMVDFSQSGPAMCWVAPDASITCWMPIPEDDVYGFLDVPPGSWSDVEVDSSAACGLHTDGSVECWGFGLGSTPSGSFVDLAVNRPVGCAIAESGELRCWGRLEVLGDVPEGSDFASVEAAGLNTFCALRENGEPLCFGSGAWPDFEPGVRLQDLSVVVNSQAACGVELDGGLVCWGGDNDPPAGEFTHVSVESQYACALAADGHIECWTHRANTFPDRSALNPPDP